jgi:hypothetical protein
MELLLILPPLLLPSPPVLPPFSREATEAQGDAHVLHVQWVPQSENWRRCTVQNR